MIASALPPLLDLTLRERRLVERLDTPGFVQGFLNDLPYNDETHPPRPTLRSFRGVVHHETAHCLEAALAAATILEQHGYSPLVLSLESVDLLDHVLFVYRSATGWGSVGRSRDPGLHGRKPAFRSVRDLVLSYVEPYVDGSGRITAYAVIDLRTLRRCDWRLSTRNVWKAERLLQDHPHCALRTSDQRFRRLRHRYLAFTRAHPDRKPLFYRNRWTNFPDGFEE